MGDGGGWPRSVGGGAEGRRVVGYVEGFWDRVCRVRGGRDWGAWRCGRGSLGGLLTDLGGGGVGGVGAWGCGNLGFGLE